MPSAAIFQASAVQPIQIVKCLVDKKCVDRCMGVDLKGSIINHASGGSRGISTVSIETPFELV